MRPRQNSKYGNTLRTSRGAGGPSVETKEEKPGRAGDQERDDKETKTGRLFKERSQAVGAVAAVEFTISLLIGIR